MTDDKKNSFTKEFFISTFIILFSLICVVVLLEIGLRVVGFTSMHMFPKEFIKKDGDFHTLAANVNGKHELKEFSVKFTTNSIGLRDKEYPPKTANDFRIVVLGDSFAMGWGVESDLAFSEIMEQKFQANQASDCNVQVLNCGVYGYGTVHEYVYLQKNAQILKPDVVILSFFIGNDIYENLDTYRLFFDKENQVYPVKKSISISLVRFIRKYSRLYDLLMGRLRNLKAFRNYYDKQTILFDAGEPHDEIELYEKSRQQGLSDYWKVTDEYILKIKQLCDSLGAKMVLVTIPSKLQVYDDIWNSVVKSLDIQNDADVLLPDKRIENLCDQNGIYYCRLLDIIKEAGKKDKDLYLKMDRHWKASGHKIVGDYLYDFELSKGLVPCYQKKADADQSTLN
jgi:hypothetical protein